MLGHWSCWEGLFSSQPALPDCHNACHTYNAHLLWLMKQKLAKLQQQTANDSSVDRLDPWVRQVTKCILWQGSQNSQAALPGPHLHLHLHRASLSHLESGAGAWLSSSSPASSASSSSKSANNSFKLLAMSSPSWLICRSIALSRRDIRHFACALPQKFYGNSSVSILH